LRAWPHYWSSVDNVHLRRVKGATHRTILSQESTVDQFTDKIVAITRGADLCICTFPELPIGLEYVLLTDGIAVLLKLFLGLPKALREPRLDTMCLKAG